MYLQHCKWKQLNIALTLQDCKLVCMIKTTKVYLDRTGGLRLYISQEIVRNLGWKNHDRVVLKQNDGKLKIYLDKSDDSVKESDDEKAHCVEAPA